MSFVSIMKEGMGYGAIASAPDKGRFIPILSESLETGKSFFENRQVKKGRAQSSRTALGMDPGGDILFPLRVDDCVEVFRSHFQQLVTSATNGTYQYDFYPSKKNPSMWGTNFGTGPYLIGTNPSAHSINLFKSVNGTGYHFQSGLCNSLTFDFQPRQEALITASMKFRHVDIVNSGTLPLGGYSDESSFFGHQASFSFHGFDLSGLKILSENNIVNNNSLGTGKVSHKFGRHSVSGAALIDMPRSALAVFGSMLSSSSFNIDGTVLIGTESVSISLPNCLFKTFDISINNGFINLPFVAYESEDGNTPSITVRMRKIIGAYDAIYGTRTILDNEIFDATFGNRIVSEHTIIDRDSL